MTLKELIKLWLIRRGFRPKRPASYPWGVDIFFDLSRLPTLGPITTIADIGANVGQSTLIFGRCFPEAEIHCFEPIEASYEKGRENTRQLGKVTWHPVAMSDREGEAVMLAAGHAETNRLVTGSRGVASNEATIPVRTQTLDGAAQLSSTGAFDLIKTDTEGHDLAVLAGGKRSLAKCKVLISEVGLTDGDPVHTPLKEVDRVLLDAGFALLGLYDTIGYWDFSWGSRFANAVYVRADLVDARPGRATTAA